MVGYKVKSYCVCFVESKYKVVFDNVNCEQMNANDHNIFNSVKKITRTKNISWVVM